MSYARGCGLALEEEASLGVARWCAGGGWRSGGTGVPPRSRRRGSLLSSYRASGLAEPVRGRE